LASHYFRLGRVVPLVGGPAAFSVSTAPSAPRSRPPAATLAGGLRPGSLRVHVPCKEWGTDRASVSQAAARWGAPPLPAMSLGACRCCPAGSRGRDGFARKAETGLRPAGVPPPERSAGGGGRPVAPLSVSPRNTRLHEPLTCGIFRRRAGRPFRGWMMAGLERGACRRCESPFYP